MTGRDARLCRTGCQYIVNVTRIREQLLPTFPKGSEVIPQATEKLFLEFPITCSSRTEIIRHAAGIGRFRNQLVKLEND